MAGMSIGDACQAIAPDIEEEIARTMMVLRGAPAPQQGIGGGAAAPQPHGGAAPPAQTSAGRSERDAPGNYFALVRSQGFKDNVVAFASLGHEKSLPLQHLMSKLSAESFRQSGQESTIDSIDYREFLAKNAGSVFIPDADDVTIESGFLDGFNGCGFLPWEGTVKDVFLKSAALYQQALLEIDTKDFGDVDLADVISARESFAGFVASIKAAGDYKALVKNYFLVLAKQNETVAKSKANQRGEKLSLAEKFQIHIAVLEDVYRGLGKEEFVQIKKKIKDGILKNTHKIKSEEVRILEELISDQERKIDEIERGTEGGSAARTSSPSGGSARPDSSAGGGAIDGAIPLLPVRDVFCSKDNIVTGPGIERMIAALCDLSCVNKSRVGGKTIFDKDSRVYSADRESAFAVAQTSSLDDLLMFADSAALHGDSSEQEGHLKSIMFDDLDVLCLMTWM